MPVTIRDIAKAAKVSITSVSFAFNNPHQLPPATVARIMDIALELGYSPNPAARSIVTKRTHSIGLLLPQSIDQMVRNAFFVEFVEGIGTWCEASGNSLLLVPPLKGSVVNAVNNSSVDGYIAFGIEASCTSMRLLRQRKTPFIQVDCAGYDDICSVNVEDGEGAYQAMRHVLDRGHRQICVMGIFSDTGSDYENYTGTLKVRMDGYRRALGEAGLDIGSPSIQFVESAVDAVSAESVFAGVWRDSASKPSAVVAMADSIAVGVYHAARTLGLRIPHDLSVVGFDDIAQAASLVPALTTVHQPIQEKGRLAAQLLGRLVAHETLESLRYILPASLVARDSVAQKKTPS